MTCKPIIMYPYAPMGNATRVSADDLARIRWESLTDPRTVANAYAGEYVRPSSFLRIAKAATRLGIAQPPPQTTGHKINERSR